MNWQLHYNRKVVQYLIALREAGHDLRMAIFSLAVTKDGIPPASVTQYEQGLYVWEIAKHHVSYRVYRSERRIMVLDVYPIPTQEHDE